MAIFEQHNREGAALKRAGLVALVVSAGLISYLSDAIPHDLWTALRAKYAAGMSALATFLVLGFVAINLAIGGALAVITGVRRLSLSSASTRKGVLVMWAGANALALAVVAGNAFQGRDNVFVEWSDLAAVLAYALVAVGVLLMRTGWKYDVRRAADIVASDARTPVVYLRSFQDDVKSPVGGAFGVWLKVLMWFFPVSFEQELAAIMNRLGPFVAVGRPGERLPELGANRFYFADDEWQARVSELVQQARLTLILCGPTASLWWEIDHVLASASPERVVLLIPERGKATRAVETRLEERLASPGAFQIDDGDRRSLLARFFFGRVRTIGKLVYFTGNWTPCVQPIRYSRELKIALKALTRPYSIYAAPLETAFEPVFARLGLPWRRPAPSRIVAICLAVAVGAFGGHLFYLGDRRRAVKYLVFCWTLVPVLLGLRDAVRLVLIDREEFESTYDRETRVTAVSPL
jgi:TM2 domain-containing membrane protein YozV